MKIKLHKSRRRGPGFAKGSAEASRDAAALPLFEPVVFGRARAFRLRGSAKHRYGATTAGPAVSAFSLTEVMIATVIFSLVMAGTIEVYIMCNKIWHATSVNMQAVRESSLALSRIVYGVETNKGLRVASGVLLLTTNVYGHHQNTPNPLSDVNKYWETGNKPPAASDYTHYTHVSCSYPSTYGSDGSWRLVISNAFTGFNCIDYNKQMRNILFWPNTNQTTAARQQRVLICNYVSAAQVTTNANGSITIEVTVEKKEGMFASSNTVSTTVKMRNSS